MADTAQLTKRQRSIYRFIADQVAQGLPPTVREIGRKFEISSPNGVECHLAALEKKGAIERFRNVSRGIRLILERGRPCPCCGKEV